MGEELIGVMRYKTLLPPPVNTLCRATIMIAGLYCLLSPACKDRNMTTLYWRDMDIQTSLTHWKCPKWPIRESHWCLVRAVIVRVMFGQGCGCIILESALMTFAPYQKAPCLLCPLRQPANSTSPGSFTQCANGVSLCTLSQLLRWLTVSTMNALTYSLLLYLVRY